MSLDLVLFFMMGWLLMTLGFAFGIRSYRETRGIKPDFPRDDQMRWIMRTAFVGYLVLMIGHAVLTATQFYLTNPTANVIAAI